MTKLDFSKIATNLLAQQKLESEINEFKFFYKKHLIHVNDRQTVLAILYNSIIKFQNIKPKPTLISDPERFKLVSETGIFLKKQLSNDIYNLYNKIIPTPSPKAQLDNPDNQFWISLLYVLSQTFESSNDQIKQELAYKTNFLIFLSSCILNYGLHPNILKRDTTIYKRYNFILEHYFKSPKIRQTEFKILLKPDHLQKDFLTPYENKLPIKINGKLIPFKSIYQIKISSTLLLDDELELFSAKHKFDWTENNKDSIAFINYCQDETEELHCNPYLINEEREKFRNQNVYFVHPTRIMELKSLKSKDFDLIKLIQLCEELNNASTTNNPISSSLLVRSIIDHIPPIFGCKNFSEVANNYKGGTKSYKNTMKNLDNSLRNIADNNIHSQVRKKEVLPNKTQVDFTPELDLLLSEIVRILK